VYKKRKLNCYGIIPAVNAVILNYFFSFMEKIDVHTKIEVKYTFSGL